METDKEKIKDEYAKLHAEQAESATFSNFILSELFIHEFTSRLVRQSIHVS